MNFFYDITDAENPLKRRVRLNEEWVNFILQNYAVIMGWLRFNKALFIQEIVIQVPGVMYKVAPENEEKRKSLKMHENYGLQLLMLQEDHYMKFIRVMSCL